MTGSKLDPVLKIGKENILTLGINISIVYCADDIRNDIAQNYLNTQKEMAKKQNFLEVWIVDKKQNTEFFSAYPMVELPFVLLLDENNQIASIDPMPVEFERQVSLLTGSAKEKNEVQNSDSN